MQRINISLGLRRLRKKTVNFYVELPSALDKVSGQMLYSSFWEISPASELCMPTFRNTVSILSRTNISISTPPMKMEWTKYSEMSTLKIKTTRNHPDERMQLSEHDESLESSSGQILASADSPLKERKI